MIKLSENTFYDPRTGIRYEKADEVKMRVYVTSCFGNAETDGFGAYDTEAETLWNWLNEEWQSRAMKGG